MHFKENKSEEESLGTFRTSSSLTYSYLTYLVDKLAIVPVSLWVHIAMQFNVVFGNIVLHMCKESEVIFKRCEEIKVFYCPRVLCFYSDVWFLIAVDNDSSYLQYL